MEDDNGVMKTLTLRCDGRYAKLEFEGSKGKLQSLEKRLLTQLEASHYKRVDKIEPPPASVRAEDLSGESGGQIGQVKRTMAPDGPGNGDTLLDCRSSVLRYPGLNYPLRRNTGC